MEELLYRNCATSKQEGGSHYLGYEIQPIDFVMKNRLDPCQANVIKYVCRFRDKGGLEDLRKAQHYLEMLISYYCEEVDKSERSTKGHSDWYEGYEEG